jgi:hypothetical protein
MEREELKLELERLADRISEGWHEGIKIDASDIMLLSEAAQALAQPAQEPDVVMHWDSHTWTTNNPPPKGSGDVNLYYAPATQRPWVDEAAIRADETSRLVVVATAFAAAVIAPAGILLIYGVQILWLPIKGITTLPTNIGQLLT